MDLLEVLWLVYQIFALFLVLCLVLFIGQTVFKVLYGYFFCYYFRAQKDLRKCYGEWAVVTGGSYGIGQFYAIELAKRKMNIVLVSRSEEKLNSVARSIGETYGVQAKVIVADLSQGKEATDKVWKEINKLDIGIFMNNAATSGGLPNYFTNLPRSDIWNLLTLNVVSATDLVHLILSGMKLRKRGLIVNVSSVASLGPNPFSSIYAASKAYMTSFSEAIRFECGDSGVEVQTLSPGYVDTGFIDSNVHLLPALFNPSPEKYAQNAAATIGHMKNTSGFWIHEIQAASLEILPSDLRRFFMTLFVDTKTYKNN